jgi:hypothetical protein
MEMLWCGAESTQSRFYYIDNNIKTAAGQDLPPQPVERRSPPA